MGDLNRSLSRLQSFDLGELEDVEGCQARWFDMVQSALRVEDEYQLTEQKFMSSTKPVLCSWLAEARDVMARQREMMDNMKEVIELMKIEALSDKEKVISVQDRLLKCQEEQLSSMRTTVVTSVQSAVQQEIKSYSAAVKQNSGPALTPDSLQKVVIKAIEEEDRSKNLMVYGLVDEEDERIDEKVSEILLELDEKPSISACRIGTKCPGTTSSCRPVKVSLSSSTSARQILLKARKLKQIERLKSVYICPDRSPEERAARKRLVADLKKVAAEQPDRQHFIREGKVVSKDKAGT